MNEGELASLVRGALQLPPGAADVAEVSENGSGKTYRVCAGGTTVALRLTPPDERDCFFTRRMQAAARAFAGAGLGPRPIAEGDGPNGGGWWVEEWGGSRSLPWTSREEYAAMGRLLARMHAVPTEWFDASRAEAARRWPLLERVTAGSHAWVGLAWGLWEASADELAESGDPEDVAIGRALAAFAQARGPSGDEQLFLDWAQLSGALAPEHPAARRVVTTHGDVHPGNVLQSGLVVDFENSCVCSAIYDLAFVVNSEARSARMKRPPVPSFVTGESEAAAARAFVEGYLAAGGWEAAGWAAEAAVDLLLTDCMLYGFLLKECGSLFWTNFFDGERTDAASARAHLQACERFAAGVRAGGAAAHRAVARGGGPEWEGKAWPCRRVCDEAAPVCGDQWL
ncbi:hypothetical protein EMIHUDRAFT_113973 [Emiliania huxleyi CCMP1516]|uniref:Aminoglycoside phosphotransferase domain-containing protein n=2 Tax=Emiliania huxleyi TaxID=2903 RepID=A0A0D3JZF1_EMIH1|nr:hypothetical protein EMIHUDRAFT_113973 [Emiliania huxleyi CCMP1516]EOD28886.1 hypothetical protein EMIHUDRAFT_113973 [Emiliania huxleyi CCMP1516]|eukprot:XP_005781315.1 hypothetical protein EMIHUDRAFT_113973 [Emiliania huxleyi CCMP1516]